MTKIAVSGAAGFIGGYLVEELLGQGHEVVGIDNYSKYGRVQKSYDDHPNYTLVEGDAQSVPLMTEILSDCDHFVAGAAMIGGIFVLPHLRLPTCWRRTSGSSPLRAMPQSRRSSRVACRR